MLPNITVDISNIPLDFRNLVIPHGIQFENHKCYTRNKIGMLVGSEICMELLCNGRSLKDSYPTLTKTNLGWDVPGRSAIDVKALNTQNNLIELSHLELMKT